MGRFKLGSTAIVLFGGQDPLVRHALGARPGPHGRLLALPA